MQENVHFHKPVTHF